MNSQQLLEQYGLTNNLSSSAKDDINRILGSAVGEAINIVLERVQRERTKAGLDPVPPDIAERYRQQAEALRLQELAEQKRKEQNTLLIVGGAILLTVIGAGVLLYLKKRKK
jgi:LPXTG-motif cell wall-anchored protein